MHPATYSDIFFAPFQLLFSFFSTPFQFLFSSFFYCLSSVFSYSSLAVFIEKRTIFIVFR